MTRLFAGRAGPWVLAALLLGAPCSPGLGAQPALVTLPLTDPAYVQLDGLARQGCLAADISDYRPYSFGAVRVALDSARGEAACQGSILQALARRFTPRAAAPDTVPADTVSPLLTIDGTPYSPAPPPPSPWRVGGAVTIQGTALRGGEFRPLWRDVRPTSEGDPPLAGTARARVTWDGGERIAAVAELLAHSNVQNDPHFRGERLRRTATGVQFSAAYLAGRIGQLDVSFGRRHELWFGQEHESMLLSAHGPALDRLSAGITTRRIEARALIAMVDPVVLSEEEDGLPEGSEPIQLHRFLLGHALTWKPSRAVRLSLGETAVVSRRTRIVDLSYANPLMAYLVTQNDRGQVQPDQLDNIVLYGTASVRVGGSAITARLLVDDFQLHAADRQVTPHQLGWSLEGSQRLPLALPASVRAEYRRVDSFTYLRNSYATVYQQYDAPLGSQLGPDADVMRGEAEMWLSGSLRASGGMGLWRRGAQRVEERPSVGAHGQAGAPFPSVSALRPAPQRAVLGDLGVELLSVTLPLSFRLEVARIENVNNQPAMAALYMRAQVAGTYAFRYP